MSFDLLFLPRPTDGDWPMAMVKSQTTPANNGERSEEERSQWELLTRRLQLVVPEVELSDSGSLLSVDDPDTGLVIESESEQTITLSMPNWYSGSEADFAAELLRRVASIVEAETGLTAYDPQAGAEFLRGDDHDEH